LAILSENNIKRIALSFLKAHYRYRPRIGQSELQLNMRAEGGIIIDGMISYQETEGKRFLATVEATSYMTRDEVRYRIQRRLLFWDGVAVGSILTLILFAVAHQQDWIEVYERGWGVWAVIALIALLLGGMLYAALFWGLRRYRYIYAVEQFKKYAADEQWIAIGADVFPSKEDRYFRELREQCIYNGFGMIVVDEKLRPHLHITPSRVDLFNQDRKRLELFSLEEFTRRLERRLKEEHEGKRLRWVPRWIASGGKQGQKLLRYRKSYVKQIGVAVLSALLLVNIFYREMQERPEAYVNEEAYTERMEKRKKSTELEPPGYLIDSSFLQPFQESVRPYLEIKEKSLPPGVGPLERRPGLIIYEPGAGFFDYDCERLYSGDAVRYVIAVEIFDTEASVRQLVQQFKERGLEAMGLWLGCFSTLEDDYVLFLQQLYGARSEAERDLPGLQDRIDREGMSAKLEILSLRK